MALQVVIEILGESLRNNTFVKMTLSKHVGETRDLQNIYVRLVEVKQLPKLSFIYRFKTQDKTYNYNLEEACAKIEDYTGNDFLQLDLFTTQMDYTLLFNKKRESKLLKKKPSNTKTTSLQHDIVKQRTLQVSNTNYLHALGITNVAGEILKEGQKKYRQIDKYIEIIDATLRQHGLPDDAHIVDMGAGKGYLTFALFDYLRYQQQMNVTMTGIELRQNLVDFCNDLSKKIKFEGLDFLAQDIFDYQPKRINMLIALHACDIATDIAIAKGIQSDAQIIVVAPCCHKQIRKAMQTQSAMDSIMKYGIMAERQAELLTDGIRALLMEAHGYQVKALEFVSVEHTPKNIMLIGIKKQNKQKNDAFAKIKEIKAQFGIEKHYLEELLDY